MCVPLFSSRGGSFKGDKAKGDKAKGGIKSYYSSALGMKESTSDVLISIGN